jgi:superfamily I DNA/RNA helicase
VPTKEFGDLATLEQKGLIEQADGVWRVRFARREGQQATLTVVPGPPAREDEHVVARVRWLVEEQHVRPEDVLVLTHRRDRAEALAAAVRAAALPPVAGVHVAFEHKDQPLTQRDKVTFSTVASAKGYDAFCVLLASADDFPADVGGRASFYVGCTRAIEYLELSARGRRGLVAEAEAALKSLDGGPRQD